jgi:hypothetical protein
MMRTLLILATALAWGLPLPAQLTLTDARAVEEATRVLAPALAEAREAGAHVTLSAAFADLDDDGAPEILGSLESVFHCGGQAPCLFVLRKGEDGGWVEVFRVPGVWKVQVGVGTTGGWRDLTLNDQVTWHWNGRTYGGPGG